MTLINLAPQNLHRLLNPTEFRSFYLDIHIQKQSQTSGGAAIVQWIHLHLPFCRRGFESHYLLSDLCYICHMKRTKISKNRQRLAYFFKRTVRNKTCRAVICWQRPSCPIWGHGLLSRSVKNKVDSGQYKKGVLIAPLVSLILLNSHQDTRMCPYLLGRFIQWQSRITYSPSFAFYNACVRNINISKEIGVNCT